MLPVQSLWVWGATAALLGATFGFLSYTDIGRAVRACSINLHAARLMGVDAERLTLIVFAVSGASGALAGAVVTPIVLSTWDAGVTYGIKGFVGAIIGGFRNPLLAVAGGIGIGVRRGVRRRLHLVGLEGLHRLWRAARLSADSRRRVSVGRGFARQRRCLSHEDVAR